MIFATNMGKRKQDGGGGNRNKKYKVSGFLDPNTTGVFSTCPRGREQGCRKELVNLFSEKIDEWYPDWKSQKEEDDTEEQGQNDEALSVEDQIKLELEAMKSEKGSKKSAHPLVQPIELDCECLVFIKLRRPVVPVDFIHRICDEAATSQQKNTRYAQKLSPVTDLVSASMEELKKLAARVLKPEFHADDQKPVKFAIQVTRRNFNTIEKDEIIKTIANCVGREHGHTVDLKAYDKLILVECYKNNIGMSVVHDYLKLEKFNMQQIFEKNMGEATPSRVAEATLSK